LNGYNIGSNLDLYIKDIIHDVNFLNTVASEKIKNLKAIEEDVLLLQYTF